MNVTPCAGPITHSHSSMWKVLRQLPKKEWEDVGPLQNGCGGGWDRCPVDPAGIANGSLGLHISDMQ